MSGKKEVKSEERCNYHLCRRKTKLYRCKYCGRYFCREHINPKLVLTKSFIESVEDRILKDKLYEEWRRRDGHPDPVWTEKFWNEIREKEEKMRKTFFEFLDRSKKERIEDIYLMSHSDKNEGEKMESMISSFYSDTDKKKHGEEDFYLISNVNKPKKDLRRTQKNKKEFIRIRTLFIVFLIIVFVIFLLIYLFLTW